MGVAAPGPAGEATPVIQAYLASRLPIFFLIVIVHCPGTLQGMTQLGKMCDECDSLHTEPLIQSSPAPPECVISFEKIHDT